MTSAALARSGAPPPDAARETVLEVADLSVGYRTREGVVPAVRGVSFDVRRGEILGLVGESGSGKSSICGALMRLLPGSAQVQAASIRFDGIELTALGNRRMRALRGTRLALIPQRPMTSLSPTTPITRQLRWFLGDRFDTPETRDLLVRLGLRAVLDRPKGLPGSFSGGQLQRLLILIAALTHEPALLLADEPTTTLDATVQAQVLRLLLAARAKAGAAILYVSHDLAVVAQISDRVGVIYGGKLVEVAPVRQLLAAPRHPYTRALIGAMPESWGASGSPNAIRGSAQGANRLPGCPFAPRCPVSHEHCHTIMPDISRDAQSMVRCHQVGHRAGGGS